MAWAIRCYHCGNYSRDNLFCSHCNNLLDAEHDEEDRRAFIDEHYGSPEEYTSRTGHDSFLDADSDNDLFDDDW